MFVRTFKSGKQTYFRLVESYHDKKTGKVRQRTLANLGRTDKINDKAKALLKKIQGNSDTQVNFKTAKDFGDVFILFEIWKQLGLDKPFYDGIQIHKLKVDQTIALIRLMVLHRVCDPDSKLHCLKWREATHVPDIPGDISHKNLLHAMDALVKNLDAIESSLAKLMLPLLDRELTLAIYDLTTVGISGEGEVPGEVRKRGKSKDTGGVARQFVLGLVQNQEGFHLGRVVSSIAGSAKMK